MFQENFGFTYPSRLGLSPTSKVLSCKLTNALRETFYIDDRVYEGPTLVVGRAVEVDGGPIRPYRATPALHPTFGRACVLSCSITARRSVRSVSVWSYLSASRRVPSASWRVLVCLVLGTAVRGRVRDGRRECRHDRTVSVTRRSSGAGGFNSP